MLHRPAKGQEPVVRPLRTWKDRTYGSVAEAVHFAHSVRGLRDYLHACRQSAAARHLESPAARRAIDLALGLAVGRQVVDELMAPAVCPALADRWPHHASQKGKGQCTLCQGTLAP